MTEESKIKKNIGSLTDVGSVKQPEILPAKELWIPPADLPEEILNLLPDEKGAALLQNSTPGLSAEAALGWINHRRKEIVRDYLDGFYDRNPEFLNQSSPPTEREELD